MVNRTYSLNLIAWLRSKDVIVHTYCENHRLYGLYEETDETKLLRKLYKEDEVLHRFLKEFRSLKLSKLDR